MIPLVLAALPASPPDVPVAPPPRPLVQSLPPGLDPALADWTPRPATGKAEPWEKATDKDWVDGRFRLMDTGPFLNSTMRFPLSKGQETIYKATAVKITAPPTSFEREALGGGVIFDRCTMRLTAAWTGGYLNHSDRRFGLLNTPTPKGEMLFAFPPGPGWADPDGKWDAKGPFTAPLPKEWVKYHGVYLRDNRTLVSYTVGSAGISERFGVFVPETTGVPDFWVDLAGGSKTPLKRHLFTLPAKAEVTFPHPLVAVVSSPGVRDQIGIAVIGATDGIDLQVESGILCARIPPRDHFQFGIVYRRSADPRVIAALVKDRTRTWDRMGVTRALDFSPTYSPKRWGEPIITKLVRGAESGPFAVDTLTIPYENPHKALFFCTGLDHLPDGRIAVCTCHGDVWLVTVNDKAATCSWQRFATGLYHPLGLKVIDGRVIVLERGQLTRLHDQNSDGEADFYECITNDWHTGAGEHSYDTCLETDPQGNFYFFKTGDTNLPSGGCLMRVSKDGGKVEVFATGFRHPIGLGMSPTGIVTGADQEGNWMPATRIDQYTPGGFYGDMRAHHREQAPKLYDGPLCWLPREVDNSAGGQVWVPQGAFGPLAGLPLHLSYGRCRPFVLLRQECGNGIVQGGVAALDVQFLSGVCRGRFGPDGHLYVCGLNGWQTAAKADGCLQRVRYTGQPLDVPVKMVVEGDTVRLTFSRPLDAKSVTNSENYRAAWWNYWWRGEYGSDRWKVSDPNAKGQDDVPVRGAKLLDDGRTVVVRFGRLQPVMQMQVGYNLLAADGRKVVGSVFLTIHTTK